MPNVATTIVILGTGGTIAGVAEAADRPLHYRAGALAVAELVSALPKLDGSAFETEEVARIDSKDMDFATWRALASRIAHHAARPEVRGIVVTHGTDTMEETAYFLARVLALQKPVILTGAMRPANSPAADGPRNLADAVALAAGTREHGVVVVMAGAVHSARDVRKVHPHRPDAFTSGDAAVLARIEGAEIRDALAWPQEATVADAPLPADDARWPRVAVVTSGAGVEAASVDALVAAGFAGIVVAATGNGTVHAVLERALRAARSRGVGVLLATRCIGGAIVDADTDADALSVALDLTPAKARVELILRLLERRAIRA